MGKVNTQRNPIPDLGKEVDLGWEKSWILFIWEGLGWGFPGILLSSGFGVLKVPGSLGILGLLGS